VRLMTQNRCILQVEIRPFRPNFDNSHGRSCLNPRFDGDLLELANGTHTLAVGQLLLAFEPRKSGLLDQRPESLYRPEDEHDYAGSV